MSSFVFGLIMFICLVPALWISFACLYPQNWKDRKLVLGVNNRKEYRQGDTAGEADGIVKVARVSALRICVVCTVLSAVFMFLPGLIPQTFVWTIFIFIAIFIELVPFIRGHKEMMELKKRLGIADLHGISYVDLKTAGSIHALNKKSLLIPLIVSLIPVIAALIADFKLTPEKLYPEAGSFLATIITLTFWLIGLLFAAIAVVIDNMKNETISTDSDINANYNRAKKKNWADVNVAILWINTAYIYITAVLFVIGISDMYVFISMVIYLVLLMTEMGLFVRSSRKIDEHYRKDTELETDDDEYWLGGMIYYNPKDRRAMVEKRAGIGTTVNFAHPVGKVTVVILALSILATLASLVWVAFVTTTPISLRVEDNKVICHQLRDEYVIPQNIIKTAEFGDIKELRLVRTSGVGTDTLLKGNFSVNGEAGCNVFLAPKEGVYIHILTNSGMNYYISGADRNETMEVYDMIK